MTALGRRRGGGAARLHTGSLVGQRGPRMLGGKGVGREGPGGLWESEEVVGVDKECVCG